jgi:hypothetical protein
VLVLVSASHEAQQSGESAHAHKESAHVSHTHSAGRRVDAKV